MEPLEDRATVKAPQRPPPLLDVQGLFAGYGRKQVVFDVHVHVDEGEIVTIIGHNGAGKTTTLKTIFGMLPVQRGRVVYRDEEITHTSCRRNVLGGMSLIPSERFVFGDMSVSDNLRLGALHQKSGEVRDRRLERVHALFPILAERAGQMARTLSGGQQRMLSLGVAMMSGPRLLMLDEPSLGLAPSLVQEIFDNIRRLATDEGLSVLLLEQNVGQALRITDRVYVMRSGRIILEETADQMRGRDQYWDLF
ncbi:MAG: ABC transporter ATP-binding protein [Acidimicrobiaceae bacterium]|nr:ABC transporter ATP-binding protein [Acidimicrobiaceae bacterium]